MSAHAIKLACWSLRFWHDYLLITCCKLRGVGLAARQGLLAACLPTKLAHKASKNNFISKSSSVRKKQGKTKEHRQLNLFVPKHPHLQPGIQRPHQQNRILCLLFIKEPRPKPHFCFSFPPNSAFYIFTSALSL